MKKDPAIFLAVARTYLKRLPLTDDGQDNDHQLQDQAGVEKMMRDEKKQRILADAQELWKDLIPNRIGAAAMIREDRDARKGTSGLRQP